MNFWNDGRRVQGLLFAIGTGLVFYVGYLVMNPFLKPLIWALALCIAFFPVHKRIEKKVKRQTVAAGISTVLVTLVCLMPFIFLASEVSQQANTVMEEVRQPESQAKLKEFMSQHPTLEKIVGSINVEQELKEIAPKIAGRLPMIAAASIWKVTEAAIIVFILFFLFRDHALFVRTAQNLLPMSDSESSDVLHRTHEAIHVTVYGHIFIAFLQGALGGVAFMFLGIPGALLLGTLMAFCALLPFVGTAAIWLPVSLLLIFSGEFGKAVTLIVLGTVGIGLLDNLLYPILVGKRIREHTLLVFFAIVGGIIAFGATGIVAGPMILALTDTLISVWKKRLAADPTV